MKRIAVVVSLFLGLFMYSCDNQADKKEVKPIQKENNFKQANDKEKVKVRKATKKADTIIDGKQVFRFGTDAPKKAAKEVTKRDVTLDVAIKDFEKGVKDASTCEELMSACRTFDYDIKNLSKKDSKINVTQIESRQDVMNIRKQSEEKSLSLCQTSVMR